MMSDEKRVELNKKRRERYKRKKSQSGSVENAPKQAHDVNPSIGSALDRSVLMIRRNQNGYTGVTASSEMRVADKQDMKGFRLKLVAILISSFLSVRRGCPLFLRNDDGPESPNDVVEIEDPKQRTTTPSNGKRDRDGNCIVGQQGTPNIIITQ
ncbi:hypothetical protein C2845_PM02G19620 [Panicum miliaceum]|uniref:Uncharacterized protein n=1 Tax=Panicum miliaceum TaxID=4540 RepID=A0A3L6S9E4_PANMI|nr:hypothetical protein C2845_PM02G19620 [Panicum miliaceum]